MKYKHTIQVNVEVIEETGEHVPTNEEIAEFHKEVEQTLVNELMLDRKDTTYDIKVKTDKMED